MSPVPGTELLKPSEVSAKRDRSIFCSNEVALGRHKTALGWPQEAQAFVGSREFQAHPRPLQRGAELETEFIIDGAYVRKPSSKPITARIPRASRWANTSMCQEGGAPKPPGQKPQDPRDLAL